MLSLFYTNNIMHDFQNEWAVACQYVKKFKQLSVITIECFFNESKSTQ